MPPAGVPDVVVTVPASVTPLLGAAGLGDSVGVMVAAAGPTVRGLDGEVPAPTVLPADGLKAAVTP